MKEEGKVSVVTAVLNRSHTIEDCIRSVITQSYNNLEYIIIDGGSTDGTLDIIKKYEDHLTHWVSEPDDGIYEAMNKGISLASGDIIATLNSDDQYLPGTIEYVFKNIGDAGILCGSCRLFNGSNSWIRRSKGPNGLSIDMALCHPSSFVKKKVYDDCGLYDTDYLIAGDYEFFVRCFKNGVQFKIVKDILTKCTVGGISDTHRIKAYIENYRVQQAHKTGSVIKSGIILLWKILSLPVKSLFRYIL